MRIRIIEDTDITGVKNIFDPTGKGGAPGVEAHDVAQFRTLMTDSRRFTTRPGFRGNLDKLFKFYYLKFLLESLGLQKMNSDSAVPGLNREAALRTSTVVPPVDAIQKFESTIAAVFSKQHNILKENHHLTQLRDWLLPMLMNGQVTVA